MFAEKNMTNIKKVKEVKKNIAIFPFTSVNIQGALHGPPN